MMLCYIAILLSTLIVWNLNCACLITLSNYLVLYYFLGTVLFCTFLLEMNIECNICTCVHATYTHKYRAIIFSVTKQFAVCQSCKTI